MIALTRDIRAVRFMETESRRAATRREGIGEILFNEYRVLISQDKKSSGDGW